ncbi:ImcF-related family protein [Acinetobacter baumannii]
MIENRPLKFSFGLYQGNELREKLKAEYLKVLANCLIPTQQNIAQYLQRVKNNKATLKQIIPMLRSSKLLKLSNI